MELDLAPLKAVAQALAGSGITFALGGSGLLYTLDLGDRVGDWDLTTDADLATIRAALGDLPWREAPHGDGNYATAHRLTLMSGGRETDLIVRFAFRTEGGVCHMPTMVCGEWQGVPVGSPEVWAVAYRLMERHPKADRLSGYLRERGARPEVVERLLAEPLPASVRSEVLSWPPPPLT